MRIAAIVLSSLALLSSLPGCDAGTGYYLSPTELAEIYGSYRLSNGDVLWISRDGGRYWAEMRSTGMFEIIPIGSIVFVAKKRNIRLTFVPFEFTTKVRVEGLDLGPIYGQPGSGIEGELGK